MPTRLCSSCSAPLPSNSNLCEYCGCYTPLDLISQNLEILPDQEETRYCPHCEVPMESISVLEDEPIVIERCPQCYGFWFDKFELNLLLNRLVKDPTINVKNIDIGNMEEIDFTKKVQYISCPVCSSKMQRRNYGYKSGVVFDLCNEHGIYLDCGELHHLLLWKKNGGEELQRLHEQKMEKIRRNPIPVPVSRSRAHYHGRYNGYEGLGLIGTILRMLIFH